MSNAETISAIADCITALSTVGAVGVAAYGMKTWKKELKGRAEFEAARELARATYAVREALSVYRSPFWRLSQYGDEGYDSVKAHVAMFQDKWTPVIAAMEQFNVAVLGAEALWGGNVQRLALDLRRCLSKVSASTEAYISNLEVDGENFKADPEFGRKVRSELVGSLDDQDNLLSVEISSAIKAIEDILRPHLSR